MVKGVYKKKESNIYLCLLSFFLIVGGIGGAVFFIFIPLGHIMDVRYNWQKVPCEIISSRVESDIYQDSETFYTEYWPSIVYSYEVKGKIYRGNKYLLYHYTSGTDSRSKKIINMLPQGKKIFCYINPSNPSMSVLSPVIQKTMAPGLLFISFFFAGILILYSLKDDHFQIDGIINIILGVFTAITFISFFVSMVLE
ncbi:MAG: DUF3592 domain-containing protein [Candidatus Eremiobacterota bacterium]